MLEFLDLRNMSSCAYEQEVVNGLDRGARFSADYRYRYILWRAWAHTGRWLVVVGLNPSTADATHDDPTIRRCIGFAKREGLGGLLMLNLFAFRATDPRVMLAADDPIGPGNDSVLRQYARSDLGAGSIVVAAWGAHGVQLGRAAAVRRMVPGLKCFGVTKGGSPRHPLYLRADTPIVDYPAPSSGSVPHG